MAWVIAWQVDGTDEPLHLTTHPSEQHVTHEGAARWVYDQFDEDEDPDDDDVAIHRVDALFNVTYEGYAVFLLRDGMVNCTVRRMPEGEPQSLGESWQRDLV